MSIHLHFDSPKPDGSTVHMDPLPTAYRDDNALPGTLTPSEKQNIGFAKAAFAFKDELDHVRANKTHLNASNSPGQLPSEKTQYKTYVVDQETMATPSTPAFPDRTERYNRRIRIFRAVQHTLTSISSIVIAVLQGLTYIKYQQTKDVPNAWPQRPTLFPTLLLMVVAIMALLFDISSLIAYWMPGKRIAEKAFRLAMNLHYWITGVKTIAYTVAAAVCRTGFAVGGNNDLWGWSCSAKGEDMQHVNDASFNCTGNTVAWILSIINIGVEVIGVAITVLVMKRDGKGYEPMPTSPNAAKSPNDTSNDSASNPLLQRYSALDSQGDDVDGALGELKPTSKT
ncbi:hypothetical protein EJ04DRAFT_581415 [Polyplosphaeria fusca]|uniref:Uncharacterized protein n=1 Tax=Polyplosphaeria fusca TaxID=682080 RepID=A0A9P4UWX4_9PLEO|nr:hypothetical protein EJ04DRAFT_581415 [Polyplosphaeria fusca]